jgi:hypothetical protein
MTGMASKEDALKQEIFADYVLLIASAVAIPRMRSTQWVSA